MFGTIMNEMYKMLIVCLLIITIIVMINMSRSVNNLKECTAQFHKSVIDMQAERMENFKALKGTKDSVTEDK